MSESTPLFKTIFVKPCPWPWTGLLLYMYISRIAIKELAFLDWNRKKKKNPQLLWMGEKNMISSKELATESTADLILNLCCPCHQGFFHPLFPVFCTFLCILVWHHQRTLVTESFSFAYRITSHGRNAVFIFITTIFFSFSAVFILVECTFDDILQHSRKEVIYCANPKLFLVHYTCSFFEHMSQHMKKKCYRKIMTK